MKIFRHIAPLKSYLGEIGSFGYTIGLVPTMGALHNGHLALIEASKKDNSVTIATIYVNPAQFNNATDLQKYPRTLDNDLQMLEKVGCDAVFCPDDAEMYEQPPIVKFDFGHLDKVMEGKFRPGHFSGVALVVSKLFNLVSPNRAYFGQKDWQQVAVIRRLVGELKFNLSICSVPIVREPDGLAMSSRNQRLDPVQRQHSTVLYRGLTWAREALKSGSSPEAVKTAVKAMVEELPDMRLEYLELSDSDSLEPLDAVITSAKPILCIAAYAGEVRLIDNLFLD
jgi:pantoate--beta-alanine ligase